MATIGETVSGGTAGSVLFVGAGPVLAQDNSNLFWDNSGKKLGIGTTSPLNDLTVRKSDAGTLGIDVINTNTTSGAANAQVFIQVAGPNGGDAVTVYEVFQGARWIVGIDNSESDKFKFVAVTTGPQLSLAMTTDGKVGVNVNDPTARLHLPAGTASLAPFKLTAGTNLTTPEAGAMEFDGTDLFITNSSGRRRYLTSDVANVLDFGAIGDGTVDDSAAFQAAVASLVDTGGVVWVPPNRKYVVGNVTINAAYPVWIVSQMFGHVLGGGSGITNNQKASIVPPAPPATATHIFKWERHSSITSAGYGAGGGIAGVCLCDITHTATANRRTPISTAAVWIDDATTFVIRECMFQWLMGTAVKVEETTFSQFENCRIDRCGATSAEISGGRPVIDIGGATTQAFVWARRIFSQNNYSESVKVRSKGLWEEHAGYYENTIGTTATVIDAAGGGLELRGCSFGTFTGANVIVIGSERSIVDGCYFDVFPGASNVITINSSAERSQVSNCHIRAAGQTGAMIDVGGNYCQLSNLYCDGGGQIKFSTGFYGQINGLYWQSPGAAAGQYAIDLSGSGWGNSAHNVYLNGAGASTCHGIRGSVSNITGCALRGFATGSTPKGIELTNASDVCVGNQIYDWPSGGTPYVYVSGAVASGNHGHPASASDGDLDDMITLNTESAVLETKSLTTAAGATYTLTWNNVLIAAGSNLQVSVRAGSSTSGFYEIINYSVSAGQCVMTVYNSHPTNAYNGTVKFHVSVQN